MDDLSKLIIKGYHLIHGIRFFSEKEVHIVCEDVWVYLLDDDYSIDPEIFYSEDIKCTRLAEKVTCPDCKKKLDQLR